MNDERTRIVRPNTADPPPNPTAGTDPINPATQGTQIAARPSHADFQVTRWNSQSSLQEGEILVNTYRVDSFIARGGMGTVYRATHILMNTSHAIKMILSDLADNPDVLEALTREASALRRVRNDAIVEYEGLLVDDRGRRFLVMQFVDGPALSDIIRERQLTPAEARVLKNRLALGLAAAHDVGIVHRDISPDNVILRHGRIEEAVLIDFGIAKMIEKDPVKAERSIFQGDFIGKYAFASPEHFAGNVEKRSDIYSLGLVLAAAAIGHGGRLKMGSSLTEMTMSRQRLPDMGPVPEELRVEIAAMLQPLPEDRPQNMYDVVDPAARLWTTRRELGDQIPTAGGGISPRILKGVLAALGIVGLLAVAHTFYPNPLLSIFGTKTGAMSEQIDAKIQSLKLNCATITAAVSQDYLFRTRVTLSGFVSTKEDRKTAIETARLPGISGLSDDLQVQPWPFCDVLDIARVLDKDVSGTTLPTIAADDKSFIFHQNDFVSVPITSSPRFGGFLYVDYFDEDGTVTHMLPNERRVVNKVEAGQAVTVGRPYDNKRDAGYTCDSPPKQDKGADYTYEICPPLGEYMIMATSSPTRLFDRPHQSQEQAATYLAAFRNAVMATKKVGGEAAVVSYRFLKTEPLEKK